MSPDNRIRRLQVRTGQLLPTQSEVWITAWPERQTSTTELRGRLVGPQCPYAATVEVAYPLRKPPPGQAGAAPPEAIVMQVIIPEASFWEPESPFCYQGRVELWQDGHCCEQIEFVHGLRALVLTESGLRLNFRPLTLRGRCVSGCSDEDAVSLHRAGYNLLVAPVRDDTLSCWEQADRFGFLVLGQVCDKDEATLRNLEVLSRHTSCLGWLVEEGRHPAFDLFPPHGFLGWRCDSGPGEDRMRWVDFLAGPAELAGLGKPLLVWGGPPQGPTTGPLLGHVE